MDFATQPKSSVLEDLAAAHSAASVEFNRELDTYRARHFPDANNDSDWSRSADRFRTTKTGQDLHEKLLVAQRKHRAARDVSESINLGQVFFMSELNQAARDRVYAAAAKNAPSSSTHGSDSQRWPECGELLVFIRANLRPPTYGEAADAREKALANVQAQVDHVLKERGKDPTKWTDEDIHAVAMAQARVAAFKNLVSRAAQLDPIWNTRTVEEK